MSTPAPPIAAPPGLHDSPLSEPIPEGGTLGQKAKAVAAVVVPPLLVLVFFIGVWELTSLVFIHPEKRFLLPPPQDILKTGFFDHQNISEIMAGLWITAKAALIGLVLAIILGMAAAIAMSQAKWVERALFPYAVILQTIPILALVPVIGFVIGFNSPSRVLVVILISIFPIITNTLFGLLSADQGQHDLFTLFKVSRFTRLWKLQLPAALPSIFTGFRTSAGLAVVGAVVGDFFFKQGDPGIGVLIDLYSSQLESERLYAAVIVASLLGVVIFVLVGFLNDRIVGRWAPSTRGGGS
jgi:NitT/TauT family transport system permease protein